MNTHIEALRFTRKKWVRLKGKFNKGVDILLDILLDELIDGIDKEVSEILISNGNTFKMVSTGTYDDLIECAECGYQCCVSIDAGELENKLRRKHSCALILQTKNPNGD